MWSGSYIGHYKLTCAEGCIFAQLYLKMSDMHSLEYRGHYKTFPKSL